ncbi:unnamed protein product [Leptidea sinapis]|uniref:Serpin domain-containing protein n=2 Tax=Leptidea sinapis TaxID=189913 RepID=A0A5E4QJW0_9NEOP|nr:unnamed protein product [Leptidea sinapis]
MSRYGRIRTASAFTILTQFVIGHAYINTFTPVAISERGVPIEIKYWDSKRTPLSHMVDVTNEFGLKVLAEHNFLNENNVAFSPYGLMGILVALFEGVDGESSFQIQRAMQLPWNRNIMRIGFRDIHRNLKTYFIPEEGFLAGLALNNENVTFTDGYRKILRFYGFDLEDENAPTPGTNKTLNETSTITTTPKENTFSTTPIVPTEGITNSETTVSSTMSNIMSTEETTTEPRESPTSSTTTSKETTNDITIQSTESDIKTTTEPITVTVSSIDASEPSEQTTISSTAPSTLPTITPMNTESINREVDIISTQITNPSESNTMLLTSTTTEDMSSASTITTSESNTMLLTSTTTEDMSSASTITTEASTSTLDSSSTQITDSIIETLERRKKSIVDFTFTSPPNFDEAVYRSFDIGSDSVPSFEGDKDFLANGLRSIQVSYMHYDTVLEYAFLPHLEAAALRLPLDSDRYYLLVVLPIRPGAGELGRLLGRMARESDLSDVYAALRPRRVKAIVPSFTVKGHVILTTDLQKLGIRDVFEPRQRDFTPMTPQTGVYVRSIEQAVSVAIRKYQPDEVKQGFVTKRNPVVFSATYPFLYFVMDANINVALMAGKLMDPLNTRIL